MTSRCAFVHQHADRVTLELHVQPGARRSELAGLHGERLKLKIAAPPVEGEANKAVCAFVAELFGVARSAVQLIRGERSREKTVVVIGATSLPAGIASLLPGI
jgi:uncharacterized protein (TIGR00251 family)